MLSLFSFPTHARGVGAANGRMAGVDLERHARFRIDEARDADVRQVPLTWILYRHRDHVVALRHQLQWLIDVSRKKIRDDKNDRVLLEHAGRVIDGRNQIGATANGLEGEKVPNDAEDVAPSLPWRNDVLYSIGEEQHTDAIVVTHCRHRQHRRELDRELALEAAHRSEALRPRKVDHQHHRQLPLLDEALHERPAHARCHVPVNGAHLVTGLILAHLGELHSLPLENRAVFSGEDRVDQSTRAQLDELHLPEDLRGNSDRLLPSPRRRGSETLSTQPPLADHGAGIADRMRATISSLVTSSASAS